MGYSHGEKWNDQRIIDGLRFMIAKKKMDTMPTHSEIKDFFGDNRLTCAMSKRGGSKYYAKILGVEIKPCESKFGDDFETLCANEIEETLGLDAEKTVPRFPYDILVSRKVKVDVKVSRLFDNYGKAKYHTFNLEKKMQTCDIFVFYCVNNEEKVERTLVIPSAVLSGKKQLSIGKQSVYNKYENQWHFISDYKDFMERLV